MQTLSNPKIRKTSNDEKQFSSLTRSKSKRVSSSSEDRPLKRASSISFRVDTPDSYIYDSSSCHSISEPTRQQILSRKDSCGSIRRLRNTFSIPFRSRSITSVSRSPSGISVTTPPHSPLVTPPSGSPFSTPPSSSVHLNTTVVSPYDTDNCFPISPITPDTSPSELHYKFSTASLTNFKRNLLSDLLDCENQVSKLTLREAQTIQIPPPSPIFEIPEILSLILKFVGRDDESKIPVEDIPNRRTPMSFNHAVLVHGSKVGKEVWTRSTSTSSIVSNKPAENSANLYNCMLVNKLWYSVTYEILQENLYFQSDSKFELYEKNVRIPAKCKSFVLHKIKTIKQSQINNVAANIKPLHLSWIEFYICPKIIPSFTLFTESLTKFNIPGNRAFNDDHLIEVAKRCPNLLSLDIRACEQITDASLYHVALNCPLLQTLNCGRHVKGDLISDASLRLIVSKCQITTLGVAGCGITDRLIWDLAIYRSDCLERLSVNSCWRLSDAGICETLRHDIFKNLSVLEIRNLRLENVVPIVEFKKRQIKRNMSLLIEACEKLENKLKETEKEIDLEISNRILRDIIEWLNDVDDNGDEEYHEFMNARRRQRRVPN